MLYDYNNRPIVTENDNDAIKQQIAEAMAQLEQLKKPAKNHRPGKATNSVWIRLTDFRQTGTVPQQQKDLATILSKRMNIAVEYKEEDVFSFLREDAVNYTSLTSSVQDVTYLLRYYRGLKNDGKRAGFVARGFIRVR
jgi:hypothetical protein